MGVAERADNPANAEHKKQLELVELKKVLEQASEGAEQEKAAAAVAAKKTEIEEDTKEYQETRIRCGAFGNATSFRFRSSDEPTCCFMVPKRANPRMWM